MPSEFDTFAAEFAAPALAEQFGERNTDGTFKTLTYRQHGGDKKPTLTKVILSPIRSRVDVGPGHGGVRSVETRTATIDRQQFRKHGIQYFSIRDIVVDDETEWNIDAETTVWGEDTVVLGLVRQPLAAFNEMRHSEL